MSTEAQTTHTLSPEDAKVLLALARAAIATALGRNESVAADAPWLQHLGACFVTLKRQGQLRGCVGSLHAHRSLLADVKANAVAAALDDSRFAPLTLEELAHCTIEVSLLSPLEKLRFDSQAQALSQLRPGIDGLVLAYHGHCSTLLPQVWQQLPQAHDFLIQLKRKAGLADDFWDDDVQLSRYTVSHCEEAVP